MEIKFQNVPSSELIDKYCKKIEYFLYGLGARLKVILYSAPSIMEFHSDHTLISKEYLWLRDFIVTTQLGELKLKNKPRLGIVDSLTNEEIWSDALIIQNEIYAKYKLPIPDPNDHEDPYWNLWKRLS